MNYKLVDPPNGVQPADLSAWAGRTLVNYDVHPAYAQLITVASPGLRLRALCRFILSYLVIKVKRAIRYEMIPLHIRKATGLRSPALWIRTACRHFVQPRRQRALKNDEPDLSLLDKHFRRHGCAVLTMPGDAIKTLNELAQPQFHELARRRGDRREGRDFDESRAYARRDQAGLLFDAIENVLRNSGVMAAASRYLGREVCLVDVNPQINDPSDDFWNRIFPDLDVECPPTAYFHRDASGGDIKAIIYMTDVQANNGPFAYVLGSHRMPLNEMDDHIAEANDSNGMAETGLINRRYFAALPKVLRQKGAFGNDIMTGSELGEILLQSTWTITADQGSIVMFDTKGIHRGGMVIAGERRVITCTIG